MNKMLTVNICYKKRMFAYLSWLAASELRSSCKQKFGGKAHLGMIAIQSPINACAKLLHSIGASCVPGHLNDATQRVSDSLSSGF